MTEQAVSPLRRRMIEDMSIRKFAAKTQHDYVQRVKDFAGFLGRSPATAESEDVRRFRLHLASSGAGAPKINATVSALRFFFKVTLDRIDLTKHLSFMREPPESGEHRQARATQPGLECQIASNRVVSSMRPARGNEDNPVAARGRSPAVERRKASQPGRSGKFSTSPNGPSMSTLRKQYESSALSTGRKPSR